MAKFMGMERAAELGSLRVRRGTSLDPLSLAGSLSLGVAKVSLGLLDTSSQGSCMS